jgi:hypothetical protein
MATNAKSKISLPPAKTDNIPEWQRQVSNWILEANQGNLNNTAIITLTANAASTVVTERRVGANSYIGFMPTTANAASEISAGTLYVSSRGKQTFTITHANNAQADRTFTYCILG